MFKKPKPRFMTDHMLIKLGKYLRILGYDAAWDTSARTHDLIQRANEEDRIFLTRNTRLADEYPAAERVLTVSSADAAEQLHAIVAACRLDVGRYLFSRCVRCNVELLEVPKKEDIASKVQPNVFARYDRFYTCPGCETVFWMGSHVRRTCRKLKIPAPAEAAAAAE